jgi:hypothetical protein
MAIATQQPTPTKEGRRKWDSGVVARNEGRPFPLAFWAKGIGVGIGEGG